MNNNIEVDNNFEYIYDNSSYYSGFNHLLSENKDGYYLNRGGLLYYISKELEAGSILSTENYSFDDIFGDFEKMSESDAFVGANLPIYLYNNKIYTLEDDVNDDNEEISVLYEWPLEGSSKKKINEFGSIGNSCIYNDILYFSEVSLDDSGNSIMKLKRVDRI